MTRKEMPLILMLLAGLVTALVAYFRGFTLNAMLVALLSTLVVFYFIGCVIKMILDSFDKKNERKVADEGEVIEKEPVTDNESQEDGNEENPNP
ncbi:MAG: hypothetical protein J6U67_00115 [Lachnospiraceae bacterium]|nr:hypothetical protein [Lachnospiraceae bacterium]